MINTCGLRLFLVGDRTRIWGFRPPDPPSVGGVSPPVGVASALAEPPLKGFGLKRLGGLTADLLVCETQDRLFATADS
jgi:hypothetical protein